VLLRQLAFYGKKTVPTKLRKDLWRPFATVTFPDAADGLHAFKLLKEYRMVRDHAWTVAAPGTGTSTSTKAVIANTGIWPNKKERAKLVMDQRATSVADLAHIIQRQMKVPDVTAKERAAEISRQKLWTKIQALASTAPEEMKKLEDERSTLQSAAADIPQHKQQGHVEKAKLKKRARRIAEITAQLNRLRKAREAVAFATGGDVEEKLRVKWSKTLKYIVQMQNPDRPVLSTYDAEKAQAKKEAADMARPSNWPRSTKYDGGVLGPKMLTKRDQIALKNASPEVDSRIAKEIPLSNILIQWANLPDAQFARSWDASVVHEVMHSKYVDRAERAHARQEEEYEKGWTDTDFAARTGVLGDKYKNVRRDMEQRGGVQKEEGKSGWLGSLNPMKLFKGGEARP
jgi:hypothetical protein